MAHSKSQNACLVCGKELIYHEESVEMECIYCHKKFMSNAACADGHYVCDTCHSKKGIEAVKEICLHSKSKNPYEIAVQMMETPFIHMHGPENHVLVGAALLAAYKDAGGDIELDTVIEEMKKRGSQVPGGTCGFWGCCGAAVSTGIFVSLVTGATPLSGKSWGLSNQMTSRALAQIGAIDGPRCCKRNAFLAMKEAVQFAEEHLPNAEGKTIQMELPDEIICTFTRKNHQCIGKRCPFNAVNHKKKTE